MACVLETAEGREASYNLTDAVWYLDNFYLQVWLKHSSASLLISVSLAGGKKGQDFWPYRGIFLVLPSCLS